MDDGTDTNETGLGAVKDIQFAIDKLGRDDEMLVIAGDNLLDFSLAKFIAYAEEKDTSRNIRYCESNEQKLLKCGVVTIDENDKFFAMTEKSLSSAPYRCCPPFYYYTKEDAKLVQKSTDSGCDVDAPVSYISWLCGKTTVHDMEMSDNRYDIGIWKAIKKVKPEYNGITK